MGLVLQLAYNLGLTLIFLDAGEKASFGSRSRGVVSQLVCTQSSLLCFMGLESPLHEQHVDKAHLRRSVSSWLGAPGFRDEVGIAT